MDNKTWIPEYDDPSSAQYQQLTSDFCGDVSPINVSARPLQLGLYRSIGLALIGKLLWPAQAQP